MKRMLSALSLVALFFGAMASISPAQDKKQKGRKLPPNVELVRDVVFGKGGDKQLRMHILRPKKAKSTPAPVLVWIHGGGWRKGRKEGGIGRLAPYAARGYFCATVEYRLSNVAKFPAQIQDCKCAIRYLRAHAKKYGLNPDRIGVWGSSAGGHLVSLLGTTANVSELEGDGGWGDQSSRVHAVCDFCGPSDMIKIVKDSKGTNNPVALLLGGPVAEKQELAKLASPVTHVSKDDAAFLIVHGDMDKLVPLEQAEMLHAALKKAGAQTTLFVAKGRGHGIRGEDVDQAVRTFFDKQLKAK